MTEVATVNAKDLARQQYGHELDWAIGTSERVDVDVPRAEAARKLAEKYPEVEPVEVWRAVVDGVARHVERPREINGSRLQLFIGATIRVDDKILIPGVIDSTTNFIEHPKLVAQRIGRYADLVGRERVIAGVDCGFGTSVKNDPTVADSIVWAKLKALSEGAALASQRLWGAKAA